MADVESEIEKSLREAAERAKRVRDAARAAGPAEAADTGSTAAAALLDVTRPLAPVIERKR